MDQLRISQADAARDFHYNLYKDVYVFKRSHAQRHNHNIICRAFESLSVWRDIWDIDLSGAGLKSARYLGRETIKTRIILYEQELI